MSPPPVSPPPVSPPASPPASPAPLGPAQTLDQLSWPPGPGYGSQAERGYKRYTSTVTFTAGADSYRLASIAEVQYLTGGPVNGAATTDRGQVVLEHSFRHTRAGAVVDAPAPVSTIWSWDIAAPPPGGGVAVDQGGNPFTGRVPNPQGGWSTIEVFDGQIALAKGGVNAIGIEYAYTSEVRRNSTTLVTPGRAVANGSSATTVKVDADVLERFSVGDWEANPNAARQGTLAGDQELTQKYSQTRTLTTNYANGTPSGGTLSGAGSLQGGYSTRLGLTVFTSRTPNANSVVLGRYDRAQTEAGTLAGASKQDYALVPADGGLKIGSGTSSMTYEDSATVALDRTTYREDFDLDFANLYDQARASVVSATDKGYDSRDVLISGGTRSYKNSSNTAVAGGVITSDVLKDEYSFRRAEATVAEGEDEYWRRDQWSTAAGGEAHTSGKNKYRVGSDGTRFDRTEVRQDFATNVATSTNEWDDAAAGKLFATDKGKSNNYGYATDTTEFDSTRDLTGPEVSKGKVEYKFTFDPARAAVVGAAAAWDVDGKVGSSSSAKLGGTITSDVKNFGPRQFTVHTKRSSSFPAGGIAESQDVVDLVTRNGVPQSGSIRAEERLLGKDSTERTTKGTLTYYPGGDTTLPPFRQETVDLTARWWGENVRGTDWAKVTFNAGVPTVVSDQDTADVGGSSTSGYVEVQDFGLYKPYQRVDYTPTLAAPAGGAGPASRTFDRSRRLTTTRVAGALNQGDFVVTDKSNTGYTAAVTGKRDLTTGTGQWGKGTGQQTTKYAAEIDHKNDRQVVGGEWNADRFTLNDHSSVRVDGSYDEWLSVDQPDGSQPVPGNPAAMTGNSYTKTLNSGHDYRERWESGSRGRGGDQGTLKLTVDTDVLRGTNRKWYWQRGAESSKGDSYNNAHDIVKTTDEFVWEAGQYKRVSFDHKIDKTASSGSSTEFTGPNGRWFRSSFRSSSVFYMTRVGSPVAWSGRLTDRAETSTSYSGDDLPGGRSSTTVTGSAVTPRDINNQFDPGWWSDTWVVAAWNELTGSWVGSAASWVWNNGSDLLRIGVGLFDVGLGVGFSATGFGFAAGIPLMALGIDQVITGGMNLRYGRVGRGFSAAETLVYWGTGSETAAVLAPAAASLGLWAGGRALTAGYRSAEVYSLSAARAFQPEHALPGSTGLVWPGAATLTPAEIEVARERGVVDAPLAAGVRRHTGPRLDGRGGRRGGFPSRTFPADGRHLGRHRPGGRPHSKAQRAVRHAARAER
ncbi:MAG: hypothetical protein K2X87_19335 [Gemmataceae bacterium]|nr:hypothetical protein [Gemmataceae bacterium]